MAPQLFSCFVCKPQIVSNDADSDNITGRHRSKPVVTPRNSSGGGGRKRGEGKLEGGGNHRKSNSLSSYPGGGGAGGGGRHSGRKQSAVARAVIEEESYTGSPEEWMNQSGSGGGGGGSPNFVGARKSANGRMEEVEESFAAEDDWNYRGRGGNNKKRPQGKKSQARQPDEEMDSFAAGGLEASSFSRNWEKSQASVSLSEWAIVCRPSADQ